MQLAALATAALLLWQFFCNETAINRTRQYNQPAKTAVDVALAPAQRAVTAPKQQIKP